MMSAYYQTTAVESNRFMQDLCGVQPLRQILSDTTAAASRFPHPCPRSTSRTLPPSASLSLLLDSPPANENTRAVNAFHRPKARFRPNKLTSADSVAHWRTKIHGR